MKDSALVYESREGQPKMKVTSMTAQGSILDPGLWSASDDSLPRLDMPDELHLVGYADEVASLVAAPTVEHAQRSLGMVMRRVSRWMSEHEFCLVLEKTEVIIQIKESIPTVLSIQANETMILSKPMVK